MPRRKFKTASTITPPLARFVFATNDASRDKPLIRADAIALWNNGELSRIDIGAHYPWAFCMPLVMDDLIHNRETPPSATVRAALDRASQWRF